MPTDKSGASTLNRLAIVDDDHSFRAALSQTMTSRGFNVEPLPNGSAVLAWLESQACDLMVLDLHLPDMSGMEVLCQVREKYPNIEVVVLTGHGTIDTAVEAMRLGAFHFLTKPCSADGLQLTLKKAQERIALLKRATMLEDSFQAPDVGHAFIGSSAKFQELLRLIDRVAKVDSSVLITGETGVGKELVARLIHNRSPRRQRPFVVVDCTTLHENLLESELFGHEAGAFTGAARLRHGLFEVATSGTIFLDEVGDVAPSLQVKLLRVLESGTFRRVGGTAEISVDVRVVAASNRDFEELIAQRLFREELFYRLNTLRIHVPALRERPEDVARLVDHYVKRFNKRFEQGRCFTPEAVAALASYEWPGNIRQLINVVEEALVMSERDEITVDQLPAQIRPAATTSTQGIFPSDLVPLSEVERHYIEYVVKRMDGHRAKAAQALRISERSLYRRLKQYGIVD